MITYIIIILYNLFDMIRIPLVGQLKLNEVIVLLFLPFYYRSNEFSRYNLLGKITLTLLVLLVCQIVTDIFVVESAPSDYLRGWSQTIISLASIIFLFKILNGYKAITLFIVASAIRLLISDPLGIDVGSSEMTFFKFRLAPVITQLLFALAIFLHMKGKTKIIPVLFLVFGLVSLSMDSRSRGLIMILSAILLYLFYTGFKFRRAYIVGGAVILIVIFQSLYIFYVNATLGGSIGGEHAREQLQRIKNPYNPFNLLVTGRGEAFAAIEAIKDAPLFGHGSWAKDETFKYYKIVLKYHDEEYNADKAKVEAGLIPSHSILLGAWVNYGWFAFLAVVYLFYLLMKMAVPLIRQGQAMPIYPIFIPTTIAMIWMFLFSPLQHLRFSVPQTAAIFLTSYYLLQQMQTFRKPESEEVTSSESRTVSMIKT
ncbi:MAG: O-antigen ligase family protein [Mangrovibacterium sp.]